MSYMFTTFALSLISLVFFKCSKQHLTHKPTKSECVIQSLASGLLARPGVNAKAVAKQNVLLCAIAKKEDCLQQRHPLQIARVRYLYIFLILRLLGHPTSAHWSADTGKDGPTTRTTLTGL